MLNQNDLVSIIIPAYNTGKYIEECLASVSGQTHLNFEVIIVDDGSTDNLSVIVERFCKQDSRFKLLKKKNGGSSDAKNLGLSVVQGKYVVFLDSDDTLHPSALEKLLQILEKDGSDIVVPARFIEFYSNSDALERDLFDFSNIENISPVDFVVSRMIYQGRAWRCSSVMYKTDVIRAHNINFDVGYVGEDVLFNLKYYLHIKKVSILNFLTLNVRKRKNSVTSSYNPEIMKSFFLIDDRVFEFLCKVNYSVGEARQIADFLLCRNVIIYMVKEMSSLNTSSFNESYKKIKGTLYNKRVYAAFGRRTSGNLYFITREKQIAANLLKKLLDLRLFILSIYCAWLFASIERIFKKYK